MASKKFYTVDENGEVQKIGIDGEAGPPGADGIGISHSWNGTVLTITSTTGTTSADLKGEKGDKGDRGATGATGAAGSINIYYQSSQPAVKNGALWLKPV